MYWQKGWKLQNVAAFREVVDVTLAGGENGSENRIMASMLCRRKPSQILDAGETGGLPQLLTNHLRAIE
jgi:hypothetical protein